MRSVSLAEKLRLFDELNDAYVTLVADLSAE